MVKQLMLALLAVTFLVPGTIAQMRGFGGPVRPGASFGRDVTFAARNHPLGSRGFYLGDTPFYYTDYPFQQFAAEPASPQIFVMRPTTEAPQELKSEPLLIELRGDRYVRFGGVQKSTVRGTSAPPDDAEQLPTKSSSHSEAVSKATEVPPAVLIYRDGHREEVSDYAIVGAVMYARGDYWSTGYWTKNIQLSALNISATMKTNRDHGVKFVLPAGPNEVVTRP
jgi:hypothetical protein